LDESITIDEQAGMATKITPVILCGGTGTRLWPLSRRDFPKPFAVEREGRSLFEWTLERALRLPQVEAVTCVTHENYRHLVQARIGESERTVLILEPEGRNTAPAMASAALLAARDDPETVLAFLPADHDIRVQESFERALGCAAECAARGRLTILGVPATSPSPSFGYILPGSDIPEANGARTVGRFIEKPDHESARQCCDSGHLWNSGMVVSRADRLIEALSRHAPDLLECCRAALATAATPAGHVRLAADAYRRCPSISFDHAVLEREADLAVVTLPAGWSDLGTWTELEKLHACDERGNRVVGNVLLDSCSNVFVHGSRRLVVGSGLEDLVIIDAPDALMVSSRSALFRIKDVVGRVEARSQCDDDDSDRPGSHPPLATSTR
jgi:mannose-1-phosphate guanylyltransferase/mannose-6-phosphate isomerase